MRSHKEKVLIMRCKRYDADRIAGIIKEGMAELHVVPSGRVLLKPNVVIAHPDVFPYAFTRKEFLSGAIAATKQMAQGASEIAVGGRSGITLPIRWTFANAGYPEVLKTHDVKACYFDEVRQGGYPAKVYRYRRNYRRSKDDADADAF